MTQFNTIRFRGQRVDNGEWVEGYYHPLFWMCGNGVEEKTKEYKDADATYTFGGGNVYIDKSGKELGNGNWIGEAIDTFRRKW